MDLIRVRLLRWAAAGVILLLLGVLYMGVVRELVQAWLTETGASHGILIPPLVVYVVWTKRDALREAGVQPDDRGIWVLFGGAMLYLLGIFGAEFFMTRVSLLVLLAGFILTFWGRARLSVLAFPLLLLVTSVPVPQLIYKKLAGPLQLFASAVATDSAQIFGISVYRDGNIIHLANASLGVEEACSGLHSLSALTIGALLVAFLNLSRKSMRAILFFSSIPIAIAANVLRVTGTAVLAEYRLDLAMGFYHSFSGWLVFVVAFGGLMLFCTGLRAMESRLG
jgi:exosortase